MSSHNATCWAVIPAAGVGSRFGSSQPKQYALLNGEPIITRTLQTFLNSQLFEQVVVPVAKNDTQYDQLALSNQVQKVIGGSSRAESVLNGLRYLEGQAKPDDWVFVHDVARPLIHPESLHDLLRALACDDVGGILVAPIADTVKMTDGNFETSSGTVLKTLDRNSLWAAQTPQMFRYKVLIFALESALKRNISVTDESMAIELAGFKVKVVVNKRVNFKITTQDDLRLAEYYLTQVDS